MKIAGLQKLTLLDYPDKLACTIFLPGCNFRCPFCHNASLVTKVDSESYIDEQEFFDFLKSRRGILQGVCITGGEPTLQPELFDFITKIKSMSFDVKLDTNGYRPQILKDLVNSGLVDFVAMDIKNCKDKYNLTVGCDVDISLIEQSVEFLKQGIVPYEFRTTVVKELHSRTDLQKIGAWLKDAQKYYLQSFVDSGDLISNGFSNYDENEMKSLLKTVKSIVPTAELRGI